MKRVFEGLIYNTETADLIARREASAVRSDFHWYNEGLYRTKKGRFFLAGEGGPLTRWRASAGHGWTDGSGIHVLSTEEAARMV